MLYNSLRPFGSVVAKYAARIGGGPSHYEPRSHRVIRERLNVSLKDASERGDEGTACTLRLVLAALKERDVAAREEIGEEAIVTLLRNMVVQRREEVARCENSARLDLAEQEADEIDVLERFLPPRLDKAAIGAAVDTVIHDVGATRLKDTGKVIATLKERYDGQVDICEAKRLVCQRLSAN